MKGIIEEMKDGLGVKFSIVTSDTHALFTIPLNPYESTEGLWVNKQVDFDIQRFWETGIEKPFDVAIILNKKEKNGKSDS